MPLMLLSNPGLHLAVLGNPRAKKSVPAGFGSRKIFRQAERRALARLNKVVQVRSPGNYYVPTSAKLNKSGKAKKVAGVPWSGKRGTYSYSGVVTRRGRGQKKTTWTNPLRILRNPMSAISNYVGAIKSAVPTTMATFKKPTPKAIGYTLAGVVGTYVVGNLLANKVLVPALKSANIASVNTAVSSTVGSRVIGAAIPLLIGAGAKLAIKGDVGNAILAGSVVAAAVAAIKPDLINNLLGKIPGIGSRLTTATYMPVTTTEGAAATPAVNGLAGLAGYVDAKAMSMSNNGVQGYVDAKAMSVSSTGVQGLSAYVEDQANRLNGVGSETVLAGVAGYLDDQREASTSYLSTVDEMAAEAAV